MARPSKKDIKAAIDKLKDPGGPAEAPQYVMPKLEEKKGRKNQIRKKGAI